MMIILKITLNMKPRMTNPSKQVNYIFSNFKRKEQSEIQVTNLKKMNQTLIRQEKRVNLSIRI